MMPHTISQILAAAAFLLLVVSGAVQVAFLLRRERRLDPLSHYLLVAAAALLLAITVERSIRIRFVAVTNTFESLVFFAGVTALVLFLYRLIAGKRLLQLVTFGGTVIALALLAIASSPIAPKEVLPPIPALQSYWLVLHVTLSFIGESFFIVGFVSALTYLGSRNEEKKESLDRLTYTSIGIGYPIFTAGALIFGAIWAQTAWGNYWSWDPKETWALITWLIYTAFLHTRLVRRLRGRISAILSIVGFAFTVFTFFGVNYLLSGLHSYG
jgi:ABC-type transport system involved in cytochrome c biogenesis permease subunit